jgi:hypothetical protein
LVQGTPAAASPDDVPEIEPPPSGVEPMRLAPIAAPPVRFAVDSPVEGAVSSEPVSIVEFPSAGDKRPRSRGKKSKTTPCVEPAEQSLRRRESRSQQGSRRNSKLNEFFAGGS